MGWEIQGKDGCRRHGEGDFVSATEELCPLVSAYAEKCWSDLD